MARQFDVVIERDSEGYYIASVPQIPACHTQAQSLDEVMLRVMRSRIGFGAAVSSDAV